MLLVSTALLWLPVTALAGPREEILKGVSAIAAPGSPGVVMTLKPGATPIVVGRVDDSCTAPVVAAAEWDKGRVVALGHSGYFGAAEQLDTGIMIENTLTWLSRGKTKESMRIGFGRVGADAWLKAMGYTSAKALPADWHARLGDFDVVLLSEGKLTDAQTDALKTWLPAGGGMLALQTGWGWQQLNGDADMRTNSLNRVLLAAGLAWTDEIIGKTGHDGAIAKTGKAPKRPKGDDAFNALLAPDEPANMLEAINELESPKKVGDAAAIAARLKQASATALRGVRCLPTDDTTLRPRLRDMLKKHAGELAVGEKRPLKSAQSMARFLLAFQIDELSHAKPADVKAHPAAALFPGAVPTNAVKVTRTVQVDTTVPRWHSTGLYAQPGEVVWVRLASPLTMSDAEFAKGNIDIRIGCHTDQLWHHAAWKRVPQIAMSRSMNTKEMTIASPFGGLIYVEVPKNCKLPALEFTIAGAVEAPLFVLGKTDVKEWKDKIRNAPGPWAEFATDKVIVSVPSSSVRGIEDPTAICQTWNEVLDAAADLATISRTRQSPQRYVADVQISAGYMHSGYPIMTHLDAADEISLAEKLKAGSWGLFHELGHNHQDGMWTFDGTGEVTCNLFSLYIMETVCKKPISKGHDAVDEWTKRRERALKHIETGADFAKWKSDPFLALEMYIQLREAFGWETYKKVFAEYRDLKAADKPKTDQDKRDQWMVRFSRAAGKNLGPFFDKWGVPVTDKAKASIAELPAWMPEEKK